MSALLPDLRSCNQGPENNWLSNQKLTGVLARNLSRSSFFELHPFSNMLKSQVIVEILLFGIQVAMNRLKVQPGCQSVALVIITFHHPAGLKNVTVY
jgi:hypothetical protein